MYVAETLSSTKETPMKSFRNRLNFVAIGLVASLVVGGTAWPDSLVLVETGGTFKARNLADVNNGSIAFAKNLISGYPLRHEISNLNDGKYGNDHSWIGNESYDPNYAGIKFSEEKIISEIAFGRDNSPTNVSDRASGIYTFFYSKTAVQGFDPLTADWKQIGSPINNANLLDRIKRHLYSFSPISGVTAIKIATSDSLQCIDEIEVYCGISISGVLPISGPSTGNTNITITGTNFEPPVTVTIGGAPATNVVVVSDTQITATTPAGFPGPAVVTVNSGSSTAFYYRPSCASDVDNNGVVDSADLGIVLGDFGNCYESLATPEEQEPMIFQPIETPSPLLLNKK